MQRVLVVDDDDPVRDMLVSFLQARGYEAFGAANGAQALIAARRDPPQLVLLDIVIPGMSGMEALRRLRKEHPEVPVIMISGNADHETALQALDIGAADFIEKPFDMVYLEKVLIVKMALAC